MLSYSAAGGVSKWHGVFRGLNMPPGASSVAPGQSGSEASVVGILRDYGRCFCTFVYIHLIS